MTPRLGIPDRAQGIRNGPPLRIPRGTEDFEDPSASLVQERPSELAAQEVGTQSIEADVLVAEALEGSLIDARGGVEGIDLDERIVDVDDVARDSRARMSAYS